MYVLQQLQPQSVMQQVPQLTQTVLQQSLSFMQQAPRQPQPILSYMIRAPNQKFMYLYTSGVIYD